MTDTPTVTVPYEPPPDLAELVRSVAAELKAQEAAPKAPWASRTVWGATLVLVSQAAALAGVQIDSGALTEIVMSAVGLIGGAVALWGRWHATQPIRIRRAG